MNDENKSLPARAAKASFSLILPFSMAASGLATGVSTSRLEWTRMPGGGISTYKEGRYCGPGWGFTRQDVESRRISLLPGIDAIDEACRHHDQCYADNGYLTRKCNVTLAKSLTAVIGDPKSTPQQRFDAAVMAAIFATEAQTIDVWMGVNRAVGEVTAKFAVATYETLYRQYVEMLSAGATFQAAIERGLWQMSVGPFGSPPPGGF